MQHVYHRLRITCVDLSRWWGANLRLFRLCTSKFGKALGGVGSGLSMK